MANIKAEDRHGECIGEHFIGGNEISKQQHFVEIGGTEEKE
jgi:hypothetical protein